jgi:hypothetical protein
MFAGLGLFGFLFALLLKQEDIKNPQYGLEIPEIKDS